MLAIVIHHPEKGHGIRRERGGGPHDQGLAVARRERARTRRRRDTCLRLHPSYWLWGENFMGSDFPGEFLMRDAAKARRVQVQSGWYWEAGKLCGFLVAPFLLHCTPPTGSPPPLPHGWVAVGVNKVGGDSLSQKGCQLACQALSGSKWLGSLLECGGRVTCFITCATNNSNSAEGWM